jgi:hypothetical protein
MGGAIFVEKDHDREFAMIARKGIRCQTGSLGQGNITVSKDHKDHKEEEPGARIQEADGVNGGEPLSIVPNDLVRFFLVRGRPKLVLAGGSRKLPHAIFSQAYRSAALHPLEMPVG